MSTDKIHNNLHDAFAANKAGTTFPIVIAIETGPGVDARKNEAAVEAFVNQKGLRFVPHDLDFSGLVVCVNGVSRSVIEELAAHPAVSSVILNVFR